VRHFSVTWARASGARLGAIAGLLGHASVTTTGIYARIVDKIAENLARYLEELMRLS
jgi:integrase